MVSDESKESKKILVIEAVEDDTALLDVLHDKFSLEGFSVLKASDGEQGLAIALSERPDLILLDLMMPKMDGLTMMKKLRQSNEWGKKVPVIILTNLSADDEKINQSIAIDAPAYYIVKSNLTINDLVEKIRERINRK
ncbi:MAG TPA: response regulator [Candidatus Paceibacterota bacterium]|nr:response regulator [Candidatus Paceibacterota bacterium]